MATPLEKMNSKLPRHPSFRLHRLTPAAMSVTFLLCLFLKGCTHTGDDLPRAQKGLLDLRQINFNNRVINLDGEWAFYWKKFINPATPSLPKAKQYISVPGSWSQENTGLSPVGYGSYHLRILLPEKTPPLAIRLKNIHTAYRAWCNGKLVARQGKVASTRKESQAETFFQNAFITAAPVTDIFLHVSNFHHKDAGIIISMQMGAEKNIRSIYEKNTMLDFFLFGSILVISIFYLMHFLLRKNDVTYLYFSIFCFTVSLRIFIFGNLNFSHLVYPLSWTFIFKAAILTYLAAVMLFARYVSILYPEEFSKNIFRIIIVTMGFFAGITVFVDTMFVSRIVQFSNAATLAAALYVIFVIIQACFRKREGAIIFLAGFIIIFITIINDILYDSLIVQTTFLLPMGFFFFLLLQTVLLSKKYTRSYHKIEMLTTRLDKNNDRLIRALVDLKFSQERLLRQEKMALIGSLATGIAHEIRNQLSAITFLEVVKGDFSEEDTHAIHDAIETRDRISSMVNEVRSLAKDEETAYTFSYYPAKEIVKDSLSVAAIDPGIESSLVTCHVDYDGLVYADKHKLIQMIIHLLSNATEAVSENRGEKKITMKVFKEDKFLGLTVRDNGRGIEDSMKKDIWEPFFTTRGDTHTGIGLDLCQRIIRGHGGNISFTSRQGEGSTFTVRIPVGTRETAGGDDT